MDGKSSTNGTIVVVDDEADIVEAMTSLLAYAFPNVRVLPTQSAEQALADCKGASLLVTDYRMPVMDGLELARRVHKADGKLPIIMVTAYQDSDLQDKAEAIGIDVLNKPFDPDNFLGMVGASLATGAA